MRRRRSRRTSRPLLAVVILLAVAIALATRQPNIIRQYKVSYTILDLKKNNLKVVPVLAEGKSGESLRSMISRTMPVAAIAGTYFDHNMRPIGDIVESGRVLCRGYQRQAIGLTEAGSIVYMQKLSGHRIDWTGIESGIACGPRLVKAGRVDLNYKRDGFSKQAGTLEATRCGIGSTSDGRLILCAVGTGVTLDKFARIMIRLGAVDAINLDGGRSCFLYSKNKFQKEVPMNMSNIITVQERKTE